MPKGHTTTNQEKRQQSKREARERRVKRAHNVLTQNTSAAERERLRA